MKRAAVAVLILLLVTAGARAQTTSAGSIRGYVRDTTGGVLPGVTVTAVSPTVPGVRTAASDTAGYYRLTDLPPGTYTVTF
jgi:predicted S18 family serine protease